MSQQNRILIVDDDRATLKLLVTILNKQGFLTIALTDSEEAWQRLQTQPESFALVLLDRIMPGLDGIAFLQRMKINNALTNIPVIMITALAEAKDYIEGLQAGAHGYLAKPINPNLLLAMIRSTIRLDYERYSLKKELTLMQAALRLTAEMSCRFRTLEEADALAYLLGNICPEPERLRSGLSELFINAIEHGNLGISYAEKTQLLMANRWAAEVEERLRQPLYRDRVVCAEIKQTHEGFFVLITDQGNGFDFAAYLDFAPARIFDLHGKGIAMAKTIYLDDVEYLGTGNQVRAFIRTD